MCSVALWNCGPVEIVYPSCSRTFQIIVPGRPLQHAFSSKLFPAKIDIYFDKYAFMESKYQQ